ncbi:MAG: hypothetical protein ACRC4T_23610 [Cetobacterium sp.]
MALIILFIIIGIGLGINLLGLFEDFLYLAMGPDKYFEWHKTNFISPKTTMPIHIIVILILFFGIYKLIIIFK